MGVSDIKTTKPFDKNNPNKVTGVRKIQREANERDAIKNGTGSQRDHIIFYDKISGISDDMFVTKTVGVPGFEREVLAIKEGYHDAIIRFMCLPGSSLVELIREMLENAFQNKDIQLLANLGITQKNLEKFYAYCCLESSSVFEATMFILNKEIFTKEEILENLKLKEPVPLYSSEIKEEGLGIEDRSLTANIPLDKLSLDLENRIHYIKKRFDLLSAAIRKDFFIRFEKSKEEFGYDDYSETFDRPIRYILD